jgi:outer membrane protein
VVAALEDAPPNLQQNLKESPIYMKQSLVLATLLASGFAAGTAANAIAQTAPAAAPASTAPAGPTKIAVIAFQVAVAQTNEGQRNFADLQKKYQPKEAQLKAQNDEIESLTKQLQTQSATLSDAAKATQARTIDEKKKKLERDAEDLRNAGGQEAQEMYNTLASKVYDVLSSYAQQQGYTLVLDVSQQQNPVLYAQQSTDISKAVVDAYNVKSGVPAPPPPPAGSGAPDAPHPAPKAPAAHQ